MATYKYGSTTAILTDLEVGDISDGTGLVWDESNNRLGINTATPAQGLHIKSSNAFIKLESSAASGVEWTVGLEGEDVFMIRDDTGDDKRLVIAASGNVGLGVSDPDERLEVNGAVHLDQVSAPGTTTDKLYNVSGSLYWNGTQLGNVGDITGVTAGAGLSGGGSSGAVTLALDLSGLSAITPTATDSFATLDSDGSTEQRTTITALSSFQAGSGLSASSGVLSVDSITSVGAVDSGSITSGFGSIDTGSSAITTTGDLSVGDATVTGGDLSFGNGQHATVSVAAVSGTDTAGKSLTVKGGQGTGSGAGGDIVFQTANAGSSGSSANSLATALTLSDDLSATFGGHVAIPESSSYKIGSNAILSDSSGTCTLSNVDALDATTEATIEGAIDTLANLTSASSLATVGTISSGTWQGTAIARSYIAADAIDGSKIDDDAIDSEHYVDGSIDTAHIADNQVTLAKMAGITRGSIIIGNASGDPALLAAGSSNYVLTSDGTDIAWAEASGGSTDLNGLSAAAVDVAADSIGIIDANDSNASRKESIADLVSAISGTGISASSGVMSLDVAASATGFVSGGVRTTTDQAGEILAMQVFS